MPFTFKHLVIKAHDLEIQIAKHQNNPRDKRKTNEEFKNDTKKEN